LVSVIKRRLMFFTKTHIKTLSDYQDWDALRQALQERIGKPPFQNYDLEQKGQEWVFRFQLIKIKPFGNDSRSLKIQVQQLANGDLQLSIREAYDWIIPVMVMALILVGVFYSLFTQEWILTIIVLFFGAAIWYYNTRLHGRLTKVFFNLLEEVRS